MRFIRDIYAEKMAANQPVISFEFFPPKTDEGDRALLEKQIPALLAAKPDFCSVTYGAGGSTREKTLQIVDRVQRQHGLPALAHLTCVNHTREEVRALLEKVRALNCKNILALRGDPPGGGEFQATPGGFEFSSELVNFIREQGNFSTGVAGFPEGHIACKAGKHADWQHLKEKVEVGADFVVTQLFFDNADYFEFRDHVAGKLGVLVPARASMELAHTAWCSRSPTRSRSTDHSHGWQPVTVSAGGSSGSSSPRSGVSSMVTERRSRQAAPSSSAVAWSTAATRIRSHEDHSAGVTSPSPTTTDRPSAMGSGIL